MNLLLILAVLFTLLFIIVTVLEKYGKRHSGEETAKWSRFIFPLIGLIMVLQALRYFFGG
ncbi:hypothetical protein ACXYTJ_11985 [Gilvimarinus sp. F26214L]|uniref:hypothetical protein n=1 Tax=Gilvimarinus sp. DZF01 TaxID=3461371 RepID=UPI00404600B5